MISSCGRIFERTFSVRVFVTIECLTVSSYAIDRHDTHLYHKKIAWIATLKCILKYYENLSRASRSNIGTIPQNTRSAWKRTTYEENQKSILNFVKDVIEDYTKHNLNKKLHVDDIINAEKETLLFVPHETVESLQWNIFFISVLTCRNRADRRNVHPCILQPKRTSRGIRASTSRTKNERRWSSKCISSPERRTSQESKIRSHESFVSCCGERIFRCLQNHSRQRRCDRYRSPKESRCDSVDDCSSKR